MIYEYKVEITAKNTVTLFCNGFPLAYFSYRDGWRIVPNTASGNPSRIGHPTLNAAGKRYSKEARRVLRDFESNNVDALGVMRNGE